MNTIYTHIKNTCSTWHHVVMGRMCKNVWHNYQQCREDNMCV